MSSEEQDLTLLAGIVSPRAGSVRVNGYDLATEDGKVSVKAMLGYLPQELGLYPELTARQFVDYMAVLKGMSDVPPRRARVEKVIDLVGLEGAADRKLKTFSGGMKRRAGIAQALVNDPRLLIVDEPTSGLDPEERIRFRNLLVGLAADRVVILSTHIVEDIGRTCGDMVVLCKGRILFRGSPAALIREAEGKVWTLTCAKPFPSGAGLSVVSMVHLADGIQYRLVGDPAGRHPQAVPAQPGLEDDYVWLMQRAGETVLE